MDMQLPVSVTVISALLSADLRNSIRASISIIIPMHHPTFIAYQIVMSAQRNQHRPRPYLTTDGPLPEL
jgi:hypothetical protein